MDGHALKYAVLVSQFECYAILLTIYYYTLYRKLIIIKGNSIHNSIHIILDHDTLYDKNIESCLQKSIGYIGFIINV